MKNKLLLLVLAILVSTSLRATTDKYRLTLRDDPATSIVIGWNQIDGTGATVYYGTTDHGTNYSSYAYSTAASRSAAFAGMDNHFARLTGLIPNTAYYFVIVDSNSTSQRFWFKTAPDVPTERLSFVAGGDSRNNRAPRQNGNRLVSKLKPHAVMFGGDMTNTCSNTEWQEWFDDWQLTISSDGRMYPVVATRGNHETNDDYIYHLFDTPRNNSSVYYALTFGGSLVRAYTLNSEIAVDGLQETWLQNDLVANDAVTWKSVQYHRPIRPHVAGKAEQNDQYASWAQKFYDYNVKLVVECDAHTVKTTWPIRPSTESGSDEGFIRDDVNGTVYVGEGCWGAPTRPNDDDKTWTRNSDVFNQFKWIFVDQEKIEVRTIKLDNATSVGENTNNDPFSIPSNLDIWTPSNGDVVTITQPDVDLSYLDACESLNGWNSSATLSLNYADPQQGIASVQFVGSGDLEFSKVFSPVYNSGANETHAQLEFDYYISDASKMGSNNQVELGSAGGADNNEFNWTLTGIQSGWNHVVLKFSEAGKIGVPDLNAINWFRFYNFKSGSITSKIDGIKIVDPSENYTVAKFEDLDNGALFHFSLMSDNKGDSPLSAGDNKSLTSMQRLDAWVRNSEFVIGAGDHLVNSNGNDPFLSFIQNDPFWNTNFYPNIADGENQAFGTGQGDWGSGWELFNYVDDFWNRPNVQMQPNNVDYYAQFQKSGFNIHLIQLHFSDEPASASDAFREESRQFMEDKLEELAPTKTDKDIIIVIAHSRNGDFVKEANFNPYRKDLLLSTADICISATIHTFERYPQYNTNYPNGAVHYNSGSACHTGSTHGYMEFHVLDNPLRVVIQYVNLEDNATRQLQTGYIDGIGDPTLALVKEIGGPAYDVDWATLELSNGQSNGASFVSQSIPSAMTPGDTVTVSVTMQNDGTSTWTEADLYKLGSQNPQDNNTWGLQRVHLDPSDQIAPGQSKIFTFDVIAPSNPGVYNFQWKMVQDNVEWFGPSSDNVTITVGNGVSVDELDQKLMMGYQGWFFAEGDGSGPNEWRHWFNSTTAPTAAEIGMDMWPDMSEYTQVYNTDMSYADGSTAALFSSHDLSTTRIHFQWMKDYNIHGVYLQRFLGEVQDVRFFNARNNVLQNVMTAASEEGRKFSIMYDVSGVANADVYAQLVQDWEYLVNTYDVANHPTYVQQESKPVVAIWGIGFKDRGLTPATFQSIIDYFHNQGAYVVGGVPSGWRDLSGDSDTNPAWAAVYRSLDMISPWTVGRYSSSNVDNWKTNYIAPDLTECSNSGVDYMPVIWPGFSWLNIHGGTFNQHPRNGGEFYWKQAYNAIDAGANFVYVAMFDEVDEGTAMFKIAETQADLPVGPQLVSLDQDGVSLPSDWYLKLADQTQRMLDGSIPLTSSIPISPNASGNWAAFSSQNVPSSVGLGDTLTISISMTNSGNTTWTLADGYYLGSENPRDNNTWGRTRVQLDGADSIEPGDTKVFTFDVVAPTTSGVYNMQWAMLQDNVEWFGEASDNAIITVGNVSNYIDECEDLTNWTSSQSLSLATNYQQGNAAIEFVGSTEMEFQKLFTTPFNSGADSADAVLRFWYYVSDVTQMQGNSQVELGSGGKADSLEYNWPLPNDLVNGWNLVDLKISDANSIGSVDLNAINWFRLYNFKSTSITTRIDAIQLLDPSTELSYSLQVNDGSGSGVYTSGTVVNLVANAAPSGQEFDQWVIDNGTVSISDVNASTTSLTMQQSAATVSATYRDIKYTLTVSSGSGSGDYIQGEDVTIVADAAPSGFEFDQWVIDSGSPVILDPTAISTNLVMGGEAASISATYRSLNLVNGASFVSQSVPAVMEAGQSMTVTVTMNNSGTKTWIAGSHFLGSQSPQDNVIWGTSRSVLTQNVAPGVDYTFSINITAPTTVGTYDFQWKMLEDMVEWFDAASPKLDIMVYNPNDYLDDCDAITGWQTSGSNSLVLSGTVQQGSGSVKINGLGTDEFKKVFSPVYNSGLPVANAYLEFWYFVSDASRMGSSNQLELGSGAGPDIEEYNWNLTGLQTGWNFISKSLASANVTGGTPDLSAIDWFRIYNVKSGTVTNRVDAIQITYGSSSARRLDDSFTESILDDLPVELSVYPNPSKDYVQIDLGSGHADKVHVIMYNMLGAKVIEKHLDTDNHSKWRLDLSRLNYGLHIMEIHIDGETQVKRIMKQ
ncbi:NBR1-Ig-like domain-containing protein [Reichenbachiella ulvae]|uniref:NBR1-Ig-like domain-containing protein n=1 Tax=Reichenbachiella ulvae TaxID=2980104 RepID=A0ABT3CNU0_9BACT|nr:NBR1-Ig-like domain-containing protein [Reichenbachiella ulvae]MCV9385267.1 NBR1-Ig-like domain-containing protein [Reichenbachiella ulvae]